MPYRTLSARTLAALTDGAARPDKLVRSSAGTITALHKRGLIERTDREAGRILSLGLRLVAEIEQAGAGT